MDDVIVRVERPRRRFTREEYHRMEETGILGLEVGVPRDTERQPDVVLDVDAVFLAR